MNFIAVKLKRESSRYASIGAVLMSQKISDGIRDKNGFWKHGHTYQVFLIFSRKGYSLTWKKAHPIACAASLAVQKVIAQENLLSNCQRQGERLSRLLKERLYSPNCFAAPFVFDIRGGGLFWGIEFDFYCLEASAYDFKGKQFGGLVQAKAMTNNLVIIGMSGGANVEGTKGDHCILSPAYNVTEEEVDLIVNIFVDSVEEVLCEHRV